MISIFQQERHRPPWQISCLKLKSPFWSRKSKSWPWKFTSASSSGTSRWLTWGSTRRESRGYWRSTCSLHSAPKVSWTFTPAALAGLTNSCWRPWPPMYSEDQNLLSRWILGPNDETRTRTSPDLKFQSSKPIANGTFWFWITKALWIISRSIAYYSWRFWLIVIRDLAKLHWFKVFCKSILRVSSSICMSNYH